MNSIRPHKVKYTDRIIRFLKVNHMTENIRPWPESIRSRREIYDPFRGRIYSVRGPYTFSSRTEYFHSRPYTSHMSQNRCGIIKPTVDRSQVQRSRDQS